MHVSPLMLGLVALVVFIVFGPKSLPKFKRDSNANLIDLSAMVPSQPAAARAPSPLAQPPATSLAPSSVAPPMATPPQHQYAMSGASPQQQPQPLKLPDNL